MTTTITAVSAPEPDDGSDNNPVPRTDRADGPAAHHRADAEGGSSTVDQVTVPAEAAFDGDPAVLHYPTSAELVRDADPVDTQMVTEYRRRYGNEAALIIGAMTGRPLFEIASMCGVSVSTVQRRLREPRVQALIRDAHNQRMSEYFGQLLEMEGTAIAVLRDLLLDPSPHVQFRAAATINRTVFQLGDRLELRQQLGELRDRIDQLMAGTAPAAAAEPTVAGTGCRCGGSKVAPQAGSAEFDAGAAAGGDLLERFAHSPDVRADDDHDDE